MNYAEKVHCAETIFTKDDAVFFFIQPWNLSLRWPTLHQKILTHGPHFHTFTKHTRLCFNQDALGMLASQISCQNEISQKRTKLTHSHF